MIPEVVLDVDRSKRIGFGEAVFSETKTINQIVEALRQAEAAEMGILLTRLQSDQYAAIPEDLRLRLDYDELSRTAFFDRPTLLRRSGEIAVVTAGSSDVAVAREALRTLDFYGYDALEVNDVGVAGLWRLQQRLPEIETHKILIVVAGMDAALPTVLGGLVSGLIIAVPTSVGYGVAAGGVAALHSVLSSCASGLVVVNIDNGYGAACAAMRGLA
ncbi:nickel pincer cofactor biosynthesis protein LarB [Nocardia asteroides]|uniref:nickel pincer cofactor biosynthesis protein LarB n=1 Tax=Nocardia asteroides TaxID=1824 RepID=UPI001E5C0BE2|nr:nickel pincer cofactor biosynthesis protein LarB [Nocardia asteroides]UGT55110.1 nickel pincer cofactor biosynthesis protein LarB [Nocardia asteroides]